MTRQTIGTMPASVGRRDNGDEFAVDLATRRSGAMSQSRFPVVGSRPCRVASDQPFECCLKRAECARRCAGLVSEAQRVGVIGAVSIAVRADQSRSVPIPQGGSTTQEFQSERLQGRLSEQTLPESPRQANHEMGARRRMRFREAAVTRSATPARTQRDQTDVGSLIRLAISLRPRQFSWRVWDRWRADTRCMGDPRCVGSRSSGWCCRQPRRRSDDVRRR